MSSPEEDDFDVPEAVDVIMEDILKALQDKVWSIYEA
jgi:hypothetical protein